MPFEAMMSGPVPTLSRPTFPTIFALKRTPLAGTCSREENSIPVDALPGAMVAGRRLCHRRLRALPALSCDRVLDRSAGLRRRPADPAVQDPDPRDLAVQEFGVRHRRAHH